VKECAGGVTFNRGTEWIHWACINFEHPDISSPYHPGGKLPANTICTTTHKCADWSSEVDRTLSVKCDGMTGVWVQNSGDPDDATSKGHYDEVLPDPAAAMLEHQCSGAVPGESYEKLEVNIENMGAGAQLSCETPPEADDTDSPTTYTVSAPNKCTLLCDGHLGMIIEGRLRDDDGVFDFYQTDVNPPTQIKGEQVKCWP